MSTHVKVIAALLLIWGGFLLLISAFAGALMGTLASFVGATHEEGAAVGATVLGLTGAALTTLAIAFALPHLIAGWGLLKFKPWSRILAIVLAAIALIQIPFGTLFGIYALVILFRKDTEALFQR
jgi:hypothetical protein